MKVYQPAVMYGICGILILYSNVTKNTMIGKRHYFNVVIIEKCPITIIHRALYRGGLMVLFHVEFQRLSISYFIDHSITVVAMTTRSPVTNSPRKSAA